jgi:NADP-dependent 3-hydroxy acid dehydrogenase YdfG
MILRFLPLEVDLTNPDAIHESIERTVVAFGTIDVIVNNAGYGMEGTVEELDEKICTPFSESMFLPASV